MKEMISELKKMYGWTEQQAVDYLNMVGYKYNPWVTEEEKWEYC